MTPPSPPLAHLRASAAVIVAYGLVAAVWVLVGSSLPGGRWLAVHLFTLGVLTNAVVVMSQHFAATLTHRPPDRPAWLLPTLNVGIVAVLVGLPTGTRWLVGAGATVATVIVTDACRRIRRQRKEALGPRFAFIVRAYERAHGAFVHGAVLGALMGLGVVSGGWYGSARVAHLHINLLGWGGITLLATLVFFGPTVFRVRIAKGADGRAAHAITRGMTGLTVAALALLVTGAGGVVAALARGVAVVGLAVFAVAVSVTCLPVVQVARSAQRTASSRHLLSVSVWFPLVAWADVLAVALDQTRFLEAVGLAMLLAVLFQSILGAMGYLAPMLLGAGSEARTVLRGRLERLPGRAWMFQAGAVAIVATAVLGRTAGTVGALVARTGWLLVLLTLTLQVVLAVAGTRGRGV